MTFITFSRRNRSITTITVFTAKNAINLRNLPLSSFEKYPDISDEIQTNLFNILEEYGLACVNSNVTEQRDNTMAGKK